MLLVDYPADWRAIFLFEVAFKRETAMLAASAQQETESEAYHWFQQSPSIRIHPATATFQQTVDAASVHLRST